MNLLHRLEFWGDTHHPKGMDIVRIVLGIFLVYKGIEFITNMSQLVALMKNAPFSSFMYIVAGHYAAFAHLVGGFLITIGLFTRFACLIQIPVLLGAVIFVNTSQDMLRPYSELFISILVLLLLIYFLVVGNGPWSYKIPDEEPKKAHNN